MTGRINVHKYLIILIFAVTLIGTANLPARSSGKELSIAVPTLPGFVTSAEGEPAAGPLVDLLRKIETASGYTFTIDVFPFRRALAKVESGGVDVGVFLRSARRDSIAFPVVQLATTNVLAVSLKESPLKTPEDFGNITIGHLRGGVGLPGPYSEQNIKYFDLNSHEQGFKMLLANRIDAVIVPDFRFREALDSAGVARSLLSDPHVVDQRHLWMYWSKKSEHTDLIKTFENEITPLAEQLSASLPSLY